MTPEEALVFIRNVRKSIFGGEDYKTVCSECCGVAIDAIQKQIPQKPKWITGGEYKDVVWYGVYHCPVCNDPLPGNSPYCMGCGQAIEWE